MRSLDPWSVFPPNLEVPVARSLSIQFILQTILSGFSIIEALKLSDRKEIKSILAGLEKILLFSLEQPMSQKGGIIDKLCFYAEILMTASSLKELQLIFELDEMRKSLLFIRLKMMIWKKTPDSYPQEEMQEQLLQLYSILLRGLGKFFTALVPFLKEARSDENVLVYLIENKEPFNRYLGPWHIEELLQSFFPAGFDQLRAVIIEGYTRRGFDAFLATIEPLIEQIQWEMPCQISL